MGYTSVNICAHAPTIFFTTNDDFPNYAVIFVSVLCCLRTLRAASGFIHFRAQLEINMYNSRYAIHHRKQCLSCLVNNVVFKSVHCIGQVTKNVMHQVYKANLKAAHFYPNHKKFCVLSYFSKNYRLKQFSHI